MPSGDVDILTLDDDNEVERVQSRPRTPDRRSAKSPSRAARMRSMSPARSRSPALTEPTVSSAQAALKRRQGMRTLIVVVIWLDKSFII